MYKQAIQHGQHLDLPKEYNCLGEMLIYIAERYPEHGMTFIDIKGTEEFLSYKALLDKASNYLAILTENGFKPSDILILIINTDLIDFYIAFWACILGGIIVAPLSQPSFELNSPTLLKLRNVWEILNKPALIVEDKYKKYYEALKYSSDFSGLNYLTTSDFKQNSKQATSFYGRFNDIAILQFSSGSTGTPKGVTLNHKNVITNLLAVSNSFEINSTDNVFTWLPHTHDMGLFLQYLSSVIAGANIFIFSPLTFTRSPYLFLKKATEHNCSWFGSPNFGLDWMIKNITNEQLATLDFNTLKFILTGSEPISANIVDEFVKKFAGRGFTYNKIRAAYGMAEVTVCATVGKINTPITVATVNRYKMVSESTVEYVTEDEQQDVTRYINVGYPIEEISMRIADEDGNTLNENIIGRVQLKGASTTAGYYNRADLNAKMFVDGWLDTGDLGFMVDGSLVITGRVKDIIFIRGQNFFAHDLEEIVFDASLVQRGNLLITGVYNDKSQQEELLVFIKHRAELSNFMPLRQLVIDLLRKQLALDITHVIPSSNIPKTTSGKLQRYAMQKAYLLGEYDEVVKNVNDAVANITKNSSDTSFSQNELENIVRNAWAKVLAIPHDNIGVDDEFFLLGGNSFKAFQMLHELSNDLNTEVDSKILVVCKTIRQIIQYIQDNADTEIATKVRSIKIDNQPIAITGFALKLPDANSPEQFWNNLIIKKDCINTISDQRRKLSNYASWNDWLGEISNIEYFDNDFFNISAEEAAFMDPQQRLLLEVSYHALEDAGVMPSLDESLNIGVYSGISLSTYLQKVLDYIKTHGVDNLPQTTLVGNLDNMISARLSSTYNFTGPAITIDTACSSALVALHHAVMALRQNLMVGALVTSANLLITPEIYALSKKAGIISSTKHAKVFDKDADGSVLGEGVLAFYLEPLDQALKMQKNIYGIIRGTAINNNGATYSVMAPDPKAQHQLLLEAYADAGISPTELSYIEVHGTGTAIGDPIEMNALSKLFSKENMDKNSIGVGSIKTNIGHLLSAAGGAGLAKLLLCLKHKKLVPNLHFNQVNPFIDMETTPFYIVNEVQPWDTTNAKTRKAGLSSFGFGGTNAHIIIEEWCDNSQSHATGKDNCYLASFSAKSKSSLYTLVNQAKNILHNNSTLDIANFCFTRNRHRTHYKYRTALLFKNGQVTATIPYRDHPWVSKLPKELNIDLRHANQAQLLADLQQYLKIPILLDSKINYEILRIKFPVVNFDDYQSQLSYLLAELYVLGFNIAWDKIHPDGSGKIINLPAYPFDSKPHWIALCS